MPNPANIFTTRDIADYYNQTQNHYEMWWNLAKGLSLHYGIWFPETKNFVEALANTNQVLANIANVKPNDYILDAGCGVGGAAIFNAKNFNAKVHGITLSEKQVAYASQKAKEQNLENLIEFSLQDYTKTNFIAETFEVVWACESVSSAINKADFVKEAFRVLKPGGKLIMSDCFLSQQPYSDPNQYLKKWGATWGVSGLETTQRFTEFLSNQEFKNIQLHDFTKEVSKTVKRMYYAYLIGLIPSVLYNTFFKASKFAKTHYLSGLYQYKSYKKGLWVYAVITAEK